MLLVLRRAVLEPHGQKDCSFYFVGKIVSQLE